MKNKKRELWVDDGGETQIIIVVVTRRPGMSVHGTQKNGIDEYYENITVIAIIIIITIIIIAKEPKEKHNTPQRRRGRRPRAQGQPSWIRESVISAETVRRQRH